MEKILVVCNHFAPDNTIAAVRVTKFAKQMKQSGYEVTVLAEKKTDNIEDEILKKDAIGIPVYRIDNSNRVKKINRLYKKIITPLKQKKYDNLDNRIRINKKTKKYEFYPFETAYPLLGSLDYLMELLRQYDLFCEAKELINQNIEIDIAFTSYGDFFSFFVGKYVHKKNKKVHWIFDIRDAMCRYKFTPKYVRWIAHRYESYVWKEADCITAVSKGICSHVPKKYWEKVHCITNGYDKNDREDIINGAKNERLRFAYTGAMYGGLRNLSPIFENIAKLIEMDKVKKDNIEFDFAGKKSAYEIFVSQADKYGIGNICMYQGQLTRKESLKLQMEANILLVSSFDYETDVGGVITGKALEYMSANKPIIAVINGDIENSELAEIIKTANLGFAYEESKHEKDIQEMYQYLLEKYNEFQEKGELVHNPNREVLAKYDYQNLGRKMMKIVDGLI